MTNDDIKKLRGLKALVQDAVVNGAKRIEEVHRATAARTFDVLEQVPAVAAPSQLVRSVHDTLVTTGYAATRAVAEAVGAGVDAALDAVDAEAQQGAGADETSSNSAPPRSE